MGKTGSSKSLAKSIVSRAMIGRNSKSPLFREFKETYFVNFQCSPLTTYEMNVKAFRKAAESQKSIMSHSVSVVNLDEIGLKDRKRCRLRHFIRSLKKVHETTMKLELTLKWV